MKVKGRIPVVGLVGGIGSGKSRVAEEFVRRGARAIAGDRLGHEALRLPEIRDRVVKHWGRAVLTPQEEVDRRKLGSIVFADPVERRALEEMVFPFIRCRLQEEIAKAQSEPECRLVIVDAAVLFEAGWDNLCDEVVFVKAPRDNRLRRLGQERGWTEQDVEARERAQLSLDEKARRADYEIDNSSSIPHMIEGIDRLLSRWGIQK